MAQFREIVKCAGVDEAADPEPTMVVPFGGTNIVALSGDDLETMHVVPREKSIEVEKLDPTSDLVAQLLRTRNELHNRLAQADADAQERTALSPDPFFGDMQYFRVHGRALVGSPGVMVQAQRGRGANAKVLASLRVVVLGEKHVKLSIRHVQVPDADGNVVLHSRKPCDAQAECAYINAVWTPQTNIIFDLVSSNSIFIDDRQPSIKQELAQALGLRDPNNAKLPEIVDPQKLEGLFKRLKDDKADFTMFMVKAIGTIRDQPNGRTIVESGFALISDTRLRTTMAHEAGHLIGGHGHTSETGSFEMLMRDGGAGWKIPLDLTMKRFMPFFDRKSGGKSSSRPKAHPAH